MKKKNRFIYDDEIYLSDIFRKLWKEKILILSICFVFMVMVYPYSLLQPKIYKTEIKIKEIDTLSLNKYSYIFLSDQRLQDSISEQLNRQINYNLMSIDNLVDFAEKNNQIDNFKSFLKKKKINLREYFLANFKFESEKLKNAPKTFSLTFEKPLAGEEFLNSYIIFIAQQMETSLLKQLSQIITSEIKLTKQNLEITNSKNPNILILSTKPESFGADTVILYQKRLANLNDQLDEIKQIKLDYNIILDKASPAIEISKSVEILLGIAFLMGLFLSSIIIFIKSTLIQ